MMMQTIKLRHTSLNNQTPVPKPDYEGFIQEIASDVVSEQSPNQLKNIRAKLYELLTKGITSDVIFQHICREFLKSQ